MTDAALVGRVEAPDIHVMSYNIRRRMPTWRRSSPDAWTRRRPLLARLLVAERPTILGVQEALPDQAEFLAETLGPGYGSVGTGRDASGSGERPAIYFDAGRLHLVRWRQFALSATHDVPGSRSWGNLAPRSVVVAEFDDRSTASRVLAVNTHLDHLSWRSRRESARFIVRTAASALADRPDALALITGDMNAGTGSPTYAAFVAAGFRDAWTAAAERLTPAWGTFSHYRPPRRDGRRIDFVFVGPGVEVRRAAINAARFDGAAPSDHEPVQAVVRAATRKGDPR